MNENAAAQAGKRAFCASLVLLCCPAMASAQAIVDFEINTPREFGYSIGNKIQHEMQLSLRAPYELDSASLPETGRLNRWLYITVAELTVQDRDQLDHYRVTIEYQIFNAPEKMSSVTIPQLEFILTGGDNPLPVFLPEWTFSIAPIADQGPRPDLRLQADRQPTAIDVAGRRVRLWSSVILLAGLLTYLAYWRWALPVLRRSRYPFTNAWRQLQRLPQSESESERYKLGLRTLHTAVNATANHVVFKDNLPQFLVDHPEYASLEADLTAFFARSRDVFFNNSAITNPDAGLRDIVELCRQCRSLERTVA